ncbi:MAG: hypothetical protein LBM25_04045 [Bacteroidales bacterium]|jgi:hypothetical protein|nr:hypothetical protein [Bacteroidales bacterium]
MKKVLVVLGLFIALLSYSCSDSKDCECDVLSADGTIILDGSKLFGVTDVKNFSGDCSQVKWDDVTFLSLIPGWDDATGVGSLVGMKLKCTEK